MEWQEKARLIPLGQKRKIPHCNTDTSAYISQNAKGVSLHCFRCGENLFEPHGRLSAQAILAMRGADEEEAERPYPDTVPLYADGVPSSAHVWVLKAGLRPETASDRYGFGWSDRSQRVIVPVLHNDDATGQWTGRATDGRKPKYLTGRSATGSMWYWSKHKAPMCVTEDILSAIRVKEAGLNSCAVLGTSFGLRVASFLSEFEIISMLDPDKAGREGFVKMRKALAPFGVEPKKTTLRADPKNMSKSEIRRAARMDG